VFNDALKCVFSEGPKMKLLNLNATLLKCQLFVLLYYLFIYLFIQLNFQYQINYTP